MFTRGDHVKIMSHHIMTQTLNFCSIFKFLSNLKHFILQICSRGFRQAQDDHLSLKYVYTCVHIRVIRKVPQRGTKSWVRSFFEGTFYLCLASSSCFRAYFESGVQILGPPLPTSQILTKFYNLTKGYAHGTHCSKSQIGPCRANLAHPFQQDKLEIWLLVIRHHSLQMII